MIWMPDLPRLHSSPEAHPLCGFNKGQAGSPAADPVASDAPQRFFAAWKSKRADCLRRRATRRRPTT